MKTKSSSRRRPSAPSAAPDFRVINAVLEEHLDLARTEANQKLLERKAGAANFSQLQEVLSFASNQDAWLNASTLSDAADKVGGRLSQRYPLLSPAAIFKIVNQATYGWR